MPTSQLMQHEIAEYEREMVSVKQRIEQFQGQITDLSEEIRQLKDRLPHKFNPIYIGKRCPCEQSANSIVHSYWNEKPHDFDYRSTFVDRESGEPPECSLCEHPSPAAIHSVISPHRFQYPDIGFHVTTSYCDRCGEKPNHSIHNGNTEDE